MSTELREGTVFAGRYQIVKRLSAGGMGTVYEVVHLETTRRRALKIMHPHILQSPEMRERFQREARVTAGIESEFIIDVSDAGVDADTGMPFLVMELLRGEEVGKRLRRLGRFSPADVVTIVQQVALALDKTHAASIIHRDLKPENLFLTERDDGTPRIKILDFGVAKLLAEGATHSDASSSVGTPLYMPPEQFKEKTVLSPASDIYALGMIAYTLLVGKSYWVEEAKNVSNVFVFARVTAHGPQEAASVRAARFGASLPAEFDAWFSTATAEDPAHRFVRASLAASALAHALGVFVPFTASGRVPAFSLALEVSPDAGGAAASPASARGPASEPATLSNSTTGAASLALRSTGASTALPRRTILLAAAGGAVLGVAGLIALGLSSGSSSPGALGAAASASALPSASADPPPPPALVASAADSAAEAASAKPPPGFPSSAPLRGTKPKPLAKPLKPGSLYSPD